MDERGSEFVAEEPENSRPASGEDLVGSRKSEVGGQKSEGK